MESVNKETFIGKTVSQFIVSKNSINNKTLFYKKEKPYWHYHENTQLSFVFQKDITKTKKHQSFLKKNEGVFFYHSGELHKWISPNPISKSINIEIKNDFLKKYNLTEEDIKNSINENVATKAILLKLQKETNLNDEFSINSKELLLLELLNFSKNLNNNQDVSWLKPLKELLNDNWNKNMSLNNISKIVGIHPVTISKYFRKYFTCTLGEYQRKLKINRSIYLIKNTNLSLSEIAYKCGFADQSHFIRNFKGQTNFLPKDFRQL